MTSEHNNFQMSADDSLWRCTTLSWRARRWGRLSGWSDASGSADIIFIVGLMRHRAARDSVATAIVSYKFTNVIIIINRHTGMTVPLNWAHRDPMTPVQWRHHLLAAHRPWLACLGLRSSVAPLLCTAWSAHCSWFYRAADTRATSSTHIQAHSCLMQSNKRTRQE